MLTEDEQTLIMDSYTSMPFKYSSLFKNCKTEIQLLDTSNIISKANLSNHMISVSLVVKDEHVKTSIHDKGLVYNTCWKNVAGRTVFFRKALILVNCGLLGSRKWSYCCRGLEVKMEMWLYYYTTLYLS